MEAFPKIDHAFYYQRDSGQNIVAFMEERLDQSKFFIQFCTKDSKDNDGLKFERQMAVSLMNTGKIDAFAAFQDESSIPTALRPQLGVRFDRENFDNFINNLYNTIDR